MSEPSKRPAWPSGAGAMAELIREHNWAATLLGPIEGWSERLKAVVDLMLAAPQPSAVYWGPDSITLYNESYIALLGGAKHPGVLGKPYREVWSEVWGEYRPIVAATMAGKAHSFVDQPVPIPRRADRPVGWFTFSWTPLRDEVGRVAGCLSVATETTERVLTEQARDRVEAELRASKEWQAFLLRLADTLRPLSDAIEIQAEVSRMLGEHLQADRTYYSEIDNARKLVVVRREHNRVGAPSMIRDYGFEFLKPLLDVMRQGQPFISNNVRTDPRVAALDPGYKALSVRSFVRVPLVRGGELVGSLGVANVAPRDWTEAEITLLQEVADRTWVAIERARAEAALRESEERFRGFAENSADVLWITDSTGTRIEYLSPAFEPVFGEPRDAVLTDRDRWRELIHPDDRERVMSYMPRALAGETAIIHYRVVRPADGRIVHLRDTGFLIRDTAGTITQVAGIVLGGCEFWFFLSCCFHLGN